MEWADSQNEAEQFLSHMRDVNSTFFNAIDMRNMMQLQGMRLQVPEDEFLEHAVWMDVWDYAIQKDAGWAMHDLALRTPQGLVANVWSMACELHSEAAIMSLLPRVKREIAGTTMLLPLLNCGEDRCAQCSNLQTRVMQRFELVPIDSSSTRCFLDDDFDAIRNAIKSSKRAGLFTLRHPILATSAKTAVAYSVLRTRALRGWTAVAVAVVARTMWSAWLARQLAPGSRYVKKVEARWRMAAMHLG